MSSPLDGNNICLFRNFQTVIGTKLSLSRVGQPALFHILGQIKVISPNNICII